MQNHENKPDAGNRNDPDKDRDARQAQGNPDRSQQGARTSGGQNEGKQNQQR